MAAEMNEKTVVFITGGNTGIGLATVQALCESSTPYNIILGSRDEQKGKDAATTISSSLPNTRSTINVVPIDLTSDSSITSAVSTLSSSHNGTLDVLINNAGAALDPAHSQGKLSTRELWNQSWDINVSGTQVLTELCAPLLLKSSNPRLLFLTSGTASLAETERTDGPMYERINGSPAAGWPKPGFTGTPAYRSVKTGLNMVAREWRRLLRGDGVKVWLISPGFLSTGLGGVGAETLREMGAGEPLVGGEFIRDVVEGKRDEDEGMAIRTGEVQAW
ncbi:hypothetical protein LTR09_006620 [Extremus antarcticus]|uniref:NAD(P)-binding protein n=1 Tax=Extremus antarcticus TaxID=702011 RepID=A0AAJ0DLX9_9PEZI|nr:hypothetical protein LTR09_006620 [Extremus antarcticus]